MSTGKGQSIAVIVCTLNRPKAVRWLVSYIDGLAGRIPSSYDLSLVLVESSPKLTCIQNSPKNIAFHHVKSSRGLPHQRNVGVEFVLNSLPNASVLAFLDDDVIPTMSFFDSVAEMHIPGSPNVIGAIDIMERSTWKMELVETLGLVPKPGKVSRAGFATAPRSSSSRRGLDWISGYAFAIHRSIFDKFRFPEEVDFFGEDVLFGLSLRDQTTISIPDSATVFHSPFGVKARSEVVDHQHRYRLAHLITHNNKNHGFSPSLFWIKVITELLTETPFALVMPSLRMRFIGRFTAIRELLGAPDRRSNLGD